MFIGMLMSCQTVQVITLREEIKQQMHKSWENFPTQKIKYHRRYDSTFFDYRHVIRSYPQILGMKNLALQDSINQVVKRKFFRNTPPHLQRWPYWPASVSLSTRPKWHFSSSAYKLYHASRDFLSLIIFTRQEGGGGATGGFAYQENALNIDLSNGQFINLANFFEKIHYNKLEEVIVKYCGYSEIKSMYSHYGGVGLDNLHFAISKRDYLFFFEKRGVINGIAEVGVPKKVLRKYVNKKYRKW